MLELYEKKYSLISNFYLLTKDIAQVLQTSEDITREKTMEAIMELLEKRSAIVKQVDELDKSIRAGAKDKAEAERIQSTRESIEIVLGKAIAIETENQKVIEKRMQELSGNIKEINDTKKEIDAYIPTDDGSIHIDVSQ